MLETHILQENDCPVIVISGRLDSLAVPELEQGMKEFPMDSDVILDVSGLEYLSSAGLRVILAYRQAVSDASKSNVILCGMQPYIEKLLLMAGFRDLFGVAGDRTEAIKMALGGPGSALGV